MIFQFSASAGSAAGPGFNVVVVGGGGAGLAEVTGENWVTSEQNPLSAGQGLSSFAAAVVGANGQPFTQGGGHPYQYITSYAVNTAVSGNGGIVPAGGDIKDIPVAL